MNRDSAACRCGEAPAPDGGPTVQPTKATRIVKLDRAQPLEQIADLCAQTRKGADYDLWHFICSRFHILQQAHQHFSEYRIDRFTDVLSGYAVVE